MSTIIYGWQQGMRNLFRNKLYTLAAIGTMATCLFLIGIIYALIVNVQNMVYHAEGAVGLTVFFDSGISEEQIQELGQTMEGLEGVDHIEYTSPQEAWNRFQDEMYEGDESLEQTFGEDNPLADSASYDVYLSDVSEQNRICDAVKGLEGVRKVVSSGTVAEGLDSFNLLMVYVSVTMIILLLLVSVFLISSTVANGIRSRRQEIEIMQMVGATDFFVRCPYLAEGVVIGLAGAVIPLVVLRVLYGVILTMIIKHFPALSQWLVLVGSGRIFAVLCPAFLVIGLGIGLAGSSISVRKHLQ